MKRTSKIAIVVIVAGILLLGVGYAALSNIVLNIGGTITAEPSQANFIVRFTGTPEVSDEAKVTAEITDELNATIDVQDLTTVEENVTATYEITNLSENLSANLTILTTNDNKEYFEITSELATSSLIAGETTTVTITVKLIKEPTQEESATVNIEMTASPVQPGEEEDGDAILFPDTFAQLVQSDPATYYGVQTDYPIDIDNDATTNDWSVFYSNGENVFLIADEYVLNDAYNSSNLLEKAATASTYSSEYEKYCVSLKSGTTISKETRDLYLLTLMPEDYITYETKSLLDTTLWNSFADNELAYSAIGGSTIEMWIESWNEKYEGNPNFSNLTYTYGTYDSMEGESEGYDITNFVRGYNYDESTKLYFPYPDQSENIGGTEGNTCLGYLLASPIQTGDPYWADAILFDGTIGGDTGNPFYGVRPVVCLNYLVAATQDGDVWKLSR